MHVHSHSFLPFFLCSRAFGVSEGAQCNSCWIFAVGDTIAIAYGISNRVAGIAPGIQQFCDCSGMTCCGGGWPESSFAWFVANGNVTTRDNYTYWGSDGRTCGVDWTFPISGKVGAPHHWGAVYCSTPQDWGLVHCSTPQDWGAVHCSAQVEGSGSGLGVPGGGCKQGCGWCMYCGAAFGSLPGVRCSGGGEGASHLPCEGFLRGTTAKGF